MKTNFFFYNFLYCITSSPTERGGKTDKSPPPNIFKYFLTEPISILEVEEKTLQFFQIILIKCVRLVFQGFCLRPFSMIYIQTLLGEVPMNIPFHLCSFDLWNTHYGHRVRPDNLFIATTRSSWLTNFSRLSSHCRSAITLTVYFPLDSHQFGDDLGKRLRVSSIITQPDTEGQCGFIQS